MAKKQQKKRSCRFNTRLLMRFMQKRVNEQELEKTEKHLCKCQECRNRVVFILVFGDKIRAEINNILDDEFDGTSPE